MLPNLDQLRQLAAEELAASVGRWEEPWSRQAAEHLSHLADALDEDRLRPLAQSLESQTSLAAVWLRALVLDRLKAFDEAAGAWRKLWWSTEGETRGALMLASARCLLAAGRSAEAWYPLREAAKDGASAKLLRQVDRLLRRAAKEGPLEAKRRCRLAILSNFTNDLLAPVLRAQCFGAGIELEVYLASFNQIVQQIQQPDAALAAFAPDAVLFAMDWRWLGLADEESDAGAARAERLRQIEELWAACRQRFNAQVLQCNFEVPPDAGYGLLSAALAGGRGRLLRSLNLELWSAAERSPGVAIVDVEQASAEFGRRGWSDAALWNVSKQYPAPGALPALGREITAVLRAVYGLSAKCVALDLDGTLWGGVIGEDGVQSIVLGGTPAGDAFVAFQRYLLALSKSGVLLAVCSKNNDADARQPFREHPEMVLKESDIALFRANWEPKEENLRAIAAGLNIGLDAMVFVDDNPAERARVRQTLPEVEVVELPTEPSLYAAAVAQRRLFDKLSLTAEDRERTASIQQNLERQSLAGSAGSLDEYLAGLGIRVELFPFDDLNLARIVQLINKTNQFNVTTRRYTESEVRAVMAQGCYTQAMRTSDRLGDSGLTGVIIAIPEGDTLRLDTWLMSCRVLGRRIDEAMFAALVEFARRAEFRRVLCEFLPTPKNEVVRDLFEQLGCTPQEPAGERRFFEWSTDRVATMPSVLDCVDRTQSSALLSER
jgi:FkbH-like protein